MTKTQIKALSFTKTFYSRGFIVYAASVIVLVFVVSAIFAPLFTKYDPNAIDLSSSLATPSSEHLFGSDLHGRDVFTRLLYGARVSLLLSIFSCIVGATVGMVLGLIAGYREGILGALIMRYVDLQLAIPPMLFTIIIGMIAGQTMFGLIFALSFGMLPGFIRLMYGLVLSLKQNDYIIALRFANISSPKIIFKHLLPNTFPTMLVTISMNLGSTIMLESTLSFLGIGIQQPQASWGSMVADGYSYIFTRPFLAFVPGICIVLLVLSLNILGDSLRDAIDPRLKGKLQ